MQSIKNILMFWGGWEGHQPKACVDCFAPSLEESGHAVFIEDSLDALNDPVRLRSFDLIVPCWTMGVLTPEQESNLCKAVEEGAGIGGWHGGMGDAFRDSTQYQFMVGGQFAAHPGNILDYDVRITAQDHPIVTGIPGFRMHSEQYYLHVDPSNNVLAETTFSGDHCPWIDGCVMPVAWTRVYGKGRVFYSALGHAPEDFDVPECFEMTRRGLLWAIR